MIMLLMSIPWMYFKNV